MLKKKVLIIFAGGFVGLLAVILVQQGNPSNMGICIACFLRDISGALGLHRAAPVQYMRPEILGLVLGAFGSSLVTREFRAIGGSNALTRFMLAIISMVGMLVFLGCPLRLLLRLAGGDFNALLGLAGLVTGTAAGAWFLNRGFTLGRAMPQKKINGYLFPVIIFILLLLLFFTPSLLFSSQAGPGSLHAPLLISLGAGLFIGILAQCSHLCMAGGIRDLILSRDIHLLSGFISLLVIALIGNLLTGSFNPGFTNQSLAHSDGVWNFLGMMLGGWGFVLLGGCPLRQLVAASDGNTDCAVTVLGLLVGAALAHNFGLAASPKGVPLAGKVSVIIGLVIIFAIAFFNSKFLTTKLSAQGVSSNVQGN